jgi:UDP-N-acetylmuramate--alanine ligase
MLAYKNIYLLGIGGIGMSGLARYFKAQGRQVAGYDRVRSPLCHTLEKEGLKLHYTDDPQLIPTQWEADNTLVIYTPAIPSDLAELKHLSERGFRIEKRSAVLGAIAAAHRTLAVAGTHGKTTTSAMLGHLLRAGGLSSTAFLGGISVNYQTNFWSEENSRFLIAEADEFDRSFETLHPWGAAITAVDADHLDVYGSAEALREAFAAFAETVQGPLLIREGLPIKGGIRYGFRQDSPYHARRIRIENHAYYFDLHYPGGVLPAVRCGLPGRYNVENALAAAALALQAGLSPGAVKSGLASFQGVRRRFEYHVDRPETVYIDDYAHHPRELRALAESVRELYPHRRLTAVFQPHLYSRTRDFMDGFAEALRHFDQLYLLNIYPARERPIPGITSEALLARIPIEKKALVEREELLHTLQKKPPELLLTIGAGDIDQLVQPIKMALSR